MRTTISYEAAIFALLALSCGWMAPISLWAQTQEFVLGSDQHLTVDSLVALVLRENQGLDATQAAAAAAAYRISPAGALEDPMLSVGSAIRSREQSLDFSQRLPWPGTLKAREAAARHEAAAAEYGVDAERLALASAAKMAYAEWYFVARAFEIHHEVQALLEELAATAQTRYSAGRALQQDLLQAEVELAEFEIHRLELLRAQAAARARINGLLNRRPEEPVPPAAPISTALPVLEMELLEQLTLERHPQLRQLEAEIAASGSRVRVARKAFFPDFTIRAGYNEMWSDPAMRATLGVSVNVPFNRSKRQADLDSVQAEQRRAESTLQNGRAELLAELARARADVIEAADSIEMYQERLLPLASEYLQAAIADYESGAGAFVNVVGAERRYFSTELRLERLHADYLRRIAELERLAGGPLLASPLDEENLL